MPRRATKRGDERTPLDGDYDVVDLRRQLRRPRGRARARRLRRAGAADRPLRDRRAPDLGLRGADRWLRGDGRRRLDAPDLRHPRRPHPPHAVDFRLPWTFSTFDYRQLCGLLYAQCDAEFETATVESRDRHRRSTRTAERLSAPLVVDALGWKRVLAGNEYQPPDAPLSRGLEVHPGGGADELEIWIDRDYVPAGYGWSFPAGDEMRIGVGSFDPRFHVKEPTVRLAEDLDRDAVRYQGNWIPHKLRAATAGGVFFVGDSAGHCLPLTAEGIRTAFYFGIACGRELRARGRGPGERRRRAAPLRRLLGPPRVAVRVDAARPEAGPAGPAASCWRWPCGRWSAARSSHWSFGHYLRHRPPVVRASPAIPAPARPAELELAA